MTSDAPSPADRHALSPHRPRPIQGETVSPLIYCVIRIGSSSKQRGEERSERNVGQRGHRDAQGGAGRSHIQVTINRQDVCQTTAFKEADFHRRPDRPAKSISLFRAPISLPPYLPVARAKKLVSSLWPRALLSSPENPLASARRRPSQVWR